jgi:diaminohydroxyphosphoribosylaminopyrimidine deaminase/5-amino-6-(5-phosphoribosylamino)uracil reductase
MIDQKHMREALALAGRGEGRVEPNPMVGCVIARGQRVIGRGWHRKFGGPHAEIEAIADAGGPGKVRGATVYVTLEPCCHHGKTPPCADALIAARVGRVVIGCVDPFPKVAGAGVRRLERAGIEVTVGVSAPACAELAAPFIKRQITGLPYVIAKWASTLDGAIATAAGHSQWISNEASRREAHRMRARMDAVVIGIGTALADDPLLTARGVERLRAARRVVIDPNLQLPMDGRLIESLDLAPLTVATANAVVTGSPSGKRRWMEARGVEFVGLPTLGHDAAPRTLDLRPLMTHLAWRHEATNIMVEGGGKTLGAFIDQGLVDELSVFLGAKLLGDAAHLAPVQLAQSIQSIQSARPLRLVECRPLGHDVHLRYRPA